MCFFVDEGSFESLCCTKQKIITHDDQNNSFITPNFDSQKGEKLKNKKQGSFSVVCDKKANVLLFGSTDFFAQILLHVPVVLRAAATFNDLLCVRF